METYTTLSKSQIINLHNERIKTYQQFNEIQQILNELLEKESETADLVRFALIKKAEQLTQDIHNFWLETYKQHGIKHSYKIDELMIVAKGINEEETVSIKRDFD